jgi:hypothetical protein
MNMPGAMPMVISEEALRHSRIPGPHRRRRY